MDERVTDELVTEFDSVDSIQVDSSARKIIEGNASAEKINSVQGIKNQLVPLPIVSSEESSWRRGGQVR
jgi:hypothetical protein